MLLHGDIQSQAMAALMESGDDLRADICDLPHHGGFVRGGVNYIKAVAPRLVLQSCGPRRMVLDPWQDHLDRLGVRRLTTAVVGMVDVVVDRCGRVTWSGFKGGSGWLAAGQDHRRSVVSLSDSR